MSDEEKGEGVGERVKKGSEKCETRITLSMK